MESYESNDILFPSEYEPHLVKIKYKEGLIDLIPKQEEMTKFLDLSNKYRLFRKRHINKKFCKRMKENTFIKI